MVCGEVVEIKVGSGTNQKSFMVHEGLLRYYSGYFEAALGGSFAEATSRIVKLEEEEVSIFKRFVLWLYTGKYTPPEDASYNFDAICKLWVLGDRRQIPLLANAMVDLLRDEIVRLWNLPTGALGFVYRNTTTESGLRRFMIWVISCIGGDRFADDTKRKEWPADATFDLLRAVWKLKMDGAQIMSKDALGKFDMCPFHQHEKNERCSKLIA